MLVPKTTSVLTKISVPDSWANWCRGPGFAPHCIVNKRLGFQRLGSGGYFTTKTSKDYCHKGSDNLLFNCEFTHSYIVTVLYTSVRTVGIARGDGFVQDWNEPFQFSSKIKFLNFLKVKQLFYNEPELLIQLSRGFESISLSKTIALWRLIV